MSQLKTKIYIDALAITSPRMSGIGHSLLSTLRQLDRTSQVQSDYTITLVVPWRSRKKVEQYKFNNLRIKRIPIPGRLINLFSRMRFQIPIDILVGKGIYVFPNFQNWKLVRSKSITYIHDICFALYPNFVLPKLQRVLSQNVPKWIDRSDLIVTVSSTSKQEIINYYKLDKSKICVVPNGVDSTFFTKQSLSKISTIKKKYDISHKYILFVSNIEPRKNIEILLKSYGQLPPEVLSKHSLFLIGGDGWLNEHVLQLIEEMKKKGFKVYRPKMYVPDEDLPALYSGASLLVHPAFHEGFSLSPLEAMSCETPVLLSNITAHKELAGKTAHYFDPSDSRDLSEKIINLLSSDELRLEKVKSARNRAHSYSWAVTVEELLLNIDRM